MSGGAGDDTIIGGNQRDTMSGGVGDDLFILSGNSLTSSLPSNVNDPDIITDFTDGEDSIAITTFSYDGLYAEGVSTEAGQLEFRLDGGNTIIFDPYSNFGIRLNGDLTSVLTDADFIFGHNDEFAGDAGDNTFVATFVASGIIGRGGNDNLSGNNLAFGNGGDGNDTISAGTSGDVIYGGAGNDNLDGGSGDDLVYGGTGNDTIVAGGQDDTVEGNEGADNINLTSGVDVVRYRTEDDGAAAGANTGHDTITNFTTADDTILFGGNFGNGGTVDIDDQATVDTLITLTDDNPDFTGTHELYVETGLADADLVEAAFTTLLAALNARTITSTTGDDGIIVAVGATETGIYLYQEASGDNVISASELRLLGIVDDQLAATDFGLF